MRREATDAGLEVSEGEEGVKGAGELMLTNTCRVEKPTRCGGDEGETAR